MDHSVASMGSWARVNRLFQMSWSNVGLIRGLVGQGKVFQAYPDAPPDRYANVFYRDFPSQRLLGLGENVIFVAIDQSFQVQQGKSNKSPQYESDNRREGHISQGGLSL